MRAPRILLPEKEMPHRFFAISLGICLLALFPQSGSAQTVQPYVDHWDSLKVVK